MISAWTRLLRLIGRSRRYLGLAAILGVVQSAVLAPIAYVVRHLFDVAIPEADEQAILLSAAAIVGLATVGALAGLTGQRLASRMARTTVADLRRALLQRLYAQPASWHDRRDPGVLLQTVVHDTDRLTIWLGQVSSTTLPALIRAVALTAVVFVLSPLLTLCVAATLPVSVLVAFTLGNRSRLAYREHIDAQVRFGARMHTGLRTLALARVNGAQGWELSRHAMQIAGAEDRAAGFDDAHARALSAQQAVVGIGGVLTLAAGSLLVADGQMSLGNLLAFYAIGVLLLRQAGLAVNGFTAAAVNAEALSRVEEILDAEPPAPRAGAALHPFTGAVSFHEVVFAYDEEPVLRGVTFDVAPGEHVSLMGPSGSGKSTIVALLLGLYEPRAGEIRVDGAALDTIELVSLRRQIGVILQDAVVFPGTIRENIAYGRDDVGDEAIAAAVARAGLDDYVAALPDGLDHFVGDEGGLVSGGQRQRIGIARALLGRPALLVLDEPTSQLDRRAIDRLLDTLDALPCTIITVTHDADVAARADRIVHVRDGMIESIEAVARGHGAVA